MSAAEDSNAAYTAGRWLRDELRRLCRLLCVPADKAEEIVRDWTGDQALDVVMTQAAWELAQLPETSCDRPW